MTTSKIRAPAKVNLTLHVTGQRADGYHLLDSLVVFADVPDTITAASAPDLSMTVTGPFAAGVPVDHTNLIMRAADALRAARHVTEGAALTLNKALPHAAGIGSGSSDAAATLNLLAALWGVDPLPATDLRVIALGADVPVCLSSPTPARMRGIGDDVMAVPVLPDCALVLIRPPFDVPTGAVFKGLTTKNGASMADVPHGLGYTGFAAWLAVQRNDLQPPAIALVPEIADLIADLQARPSVGFAGMSGSGATCFALLADLDAAQALAADLGQFYPDCWFAAARML